MKSPATIRVNFIEADEVLLETARCANGDHYICESRFLGRQYRTAHLVVDDIADTTIEVLRFCRSSMTAEDVTEEVAEEYLKDFDAREGVTIEDETRFPEYVKRSMVWRRWKDDLEAEQPVQRDFDMPRVQRREAQFGAAA